MPSLPEINQHAHRQFLHPNKLPWSSVRTAEELEFLSTAVVGGKGEEAKACAYLYKELAQLAEIEFHVASVMVRVIGEGANRSDSRPWLGSDLVQAISCFAAEETQHASTFFRYVRELTGKDFKIENNLYRERLAVYEGDEDPLVKLAALCATAYVGESVITVFETRLKGLDPGCQHFLTQLLHLHGLDEARHVRFDHLVFDEVIPGLGAREREQMESLINATEALNTQLAIAAKNQFTRQFDIDFSQGNLSAEVQFEMTQAFRTAILAGTSVRKIDDHMTRETRELVNRFSSSEIVHAIAA